MVNFGSSRRRRRRWCGVARLAVTCAANAHRNSRPLAEQAHNRDHKSTDPCGQTKKQHKVVAEVKRHPRPLRMGGTLECSPAKSARPARGRHDASNMVYEGLKRP